MSKTMNDKLARETWIDCLIQLGKMGDYIGKQGNLYVYVTPDGHMTLEALEKRYKVRFSMFKKGSKPHRYVVDVNFLCETLTRVNNESDY